MTERLTLATSTGLPFVLLAFHVAMGITAFASGVIAIAARKGGTWHRLAGLIFVTAMIAMGLTAVAIGVYEGKQDVAGGAFTAYLVFTAWITLRPLRGAGRGMDVGLMVLALVFAAATFQNGLIAFERPRHSLNGVPAGMFIFLGTIAVLAIIGDFRMIRSGGLQGTRRLARHLWRMCFALFMATGSFTAQLVRMTFMPAALRSLPVILLLSVAPLAVLLYWMWRVRLNQNLRGLVTRKPLEAGQPG